MRFLVGDARITKEDTLLVAAVVPYPECDTQISYSLGIARISLSVVLLLEKEKWSRGDEIPCWRGPQGCAD
jgi:hypothetical protein